MRKLTTLLLVAVLIASTTGCGGKIRSWFHRGSPCGTTTVAPAVLGAPLAINAPAAAPAVTTPMFAAPAVVSGGCCQAAPVCATPCVPCDSGCGNCCDVPCGDCGCADPSGVICGSSGYASGCSDCVGGTAVEPYEGQIIEGDAGSREPYGDPRPVEEN